MLQKKKNDEIVWRQEFEEKKITSPKYSNVINCGKGGFVHAVF